jgi:hypothetical protein
MPCSIAAYYQACYEVSTSKNQPQKLLSALTHFAEHERRQGERVFEIQSAITGDLPSFLKELVDRYLCSMGEIDSLLERFRYASEGKTFPIPRIIGLQVLSTFPQVRGHLQELLTEIHSHIFNTEFGTQSRTNGNYSGDGIGETGWPMNS